MSRFYKIFIGLILLNLLLLSQSIAQVCNNANEVYVLRSSGKVRTADISTGTVGSVDLNTSGGSPSSANALGYNAFNNKFYYFRRIPGTGSPSEFVCFTPSTSGSGNSETLLAQNPSSSSIVSGCVSSNGAGYYCIAGDGTLYYYNIAANTWTTISNTYKLSNGTDVSSNFQNKSGDMAIDGNGKLWFILSSTSDYMLYKIPGTLPTSAQSYITVSEVVESTATPTSSQFAGICFNATGQIIMINASGRLYRLENNLSLTFLTTISNTNYSQDLTSCAYPNSVLPILWREFTVSVNSNNTANLNWKVDASSTEREFKVELSNDGSSWRTVTTIPPFTSTTGMRSYSMKFENLSEGIYYTRIQGLDESGNTSYSVVRQFTITGTSRVRIWPNPSKNQLNLFIENNIPATTPALIFDKTGRLLSEQKVQQGKNTLNIDKLQPGTYFISIESPGNMTPFKQLFTKVN
ncbi:MAG: T9SS type A sorting domain-containing protein [Chitinophagaceae bacterium]|uniref:T9SS type A sorting domain-containing protein n=1 Tax=unclassified Paraflavitalea TaxID=2798305 RepID=UPI003D35817F|nr:T9SS type A sorting domain-containing protein [Chitinophagaceae bacterium]